MNLNLIFYISKSILISTFLITILSPMGLSYANSVNRLKPFSSDGCSAVADAFLNKNWVNCCIKHDIEYWVGGSENDKDLADKELEKCVGASTFPLFGSLFYSGVSLGGSPSLPTSWRWGYGYVHNHGYSPRTMEEKLLVLDMQQKLEPYFYDDESISKFPYGSLYCIEQNEDFEIKVTLNRQGSFTGEVCNAKNKVRVLELIGDGIDGTFNLSNGVEIIQLKNKSNKHDYVTLNLVEDNTCLPTHSKERFLFTGFLMYPTTDGELYKLLHNKKLCCDIQRNKF